MGHIDEAKNHLYAVAEAEPTMKWHQIVHHVRRAICHLVTYEAERRDAALRDAASRPNPLAEIRQMADELVRGLARLAERSGTSVSERWCPEPQPGQTVPKREALETAPGLERPDPIIVKMDPPTLFPMVTASAVVWGRIVHGEKIETSEFDGDYTFSDPIVLVRGPHHAGRVAFCHVEDNTVRAYTVNVSRF